MSLVEEIRQSWGWVGIEPVEVVGENDFGNLIIKDEEGKFWRLCPEDCYCEVTDNAFMESFFHSMKSETIDGHLYSGWTWPDQFQ